MHGVFLLNERGDTIISVGNGRLQGDSDMIGGLIGALQMLVSKASCDEIKSVTLEDLKMYMRKAGSNHVVTLHDVNDNMAEIQNHRIAKFIQDNPTVGATDGFVDLVNSMISDESESF